METAPIGRPPQAASIAPVTRADPPAAASPVRTELPREQAVQQTGEEEAVRFENRPGLDARVALEAAFAEAVDRRVRIDEATKAVVYQSVDNETGEVVQQFPDETMLKIRTYVRELQARATEPQNDSTVVKSA